MHALLPVCRRINRRLALCLAALLVLAGLPAGAPPVGAALPETIVFDGTPRNVSGTEAKSVYPNVALDANRNAHIVYLEQEGSGRLMYTNNIGGQFAPPQPIVGDIGDDTDPFLLFGPGNVLSLAYSMNGTSILYRQGQISGANVIWGNPEQIFSGADKSYTGHMAIDSGGSVHFVWINKDCGSYRIYYRARLPGGSLTPFENPRPNCEFQTRPRITITADGRPHIAFQLGNEVHYARKEGAAWVQQNISQTSATNSNNHSIASDGTGLFLAWGEGINGQDVRFRYSADGGQNWTQIIELSNNERYAQYPYVVWSPVSRRAYIAYSDTTGAPETRTELWMREFNPANGVTSDALRITNQPNDSNLAHMVVSGNRLELAWQDRFSTDPELTNLKIFHTSATLRGGCSGALVLEGGAATSGDRSVAGAITPSNGCTPAQMQISLGAPPAEDAAKQAYSATVSVDAPEGACAVRVYVRLFNAEGIGGEPFSDDITVDSGVNALVVALNPNLANTPDLLAPQGIAASGASNGSDSYTRDRLFSLQIANDGDCSGLKSFAVTNSIGGELTGGGFGGSVPLPGDDAPGAKAVSVVVTDTVDHVATFPSITETFSLIYDPADLDPSPTITNTGGLPVLSAGGSVAAEDINSIVRALSFSGITVTDNLYGQREGLAPGRQFWGVWLANSRSPGDGNNPALRWHSVPVASPDATFTVPQWNLFNGVTFGEGEARTGNYYVYARFLDGAGNPSQDYLTATAVLTDGFTQLTLSLPLALK